jgi:hypothetical protein
MVDRPALLQALTAQLKGLSTRDSLTIEKALNTAVAVTIKLISLPIARALADPAKADLTRAFSAALTQKDLSAVLKQWDPKRDHKASLSQTEAATALGDLLAGKSEPYVPCTHTLVNARQVSDTIKTALAHDIRERMPEADRKKLLKKWDPHARADSLTAEGAASARLIALL